MGRASRAAVAPQAHRGDNVSSHDEESPSDGAMDEGAGRPLSEAEAEEDKVDEEDKVEKEEQGEQEQQEQQEDAAHQTHAGGERAKARATVGAQGEAPLASPSQTLYINNLSERLRKGDLRRYLYGLFSEHGQILDVVALKTPSARGQAFVVYKELAGAIAAMRSLQGYPFFGKSLRSQFARTPSRAAVDFERFALEPDRRERAAAMHAPPSAAPK